MSNGIKAYGLTNLRWNYQSQMIMKPAIKQYNITLSLGWRLLKKPKNIWIKVKFTLIIVGDLLYKFQMGFDIAVEVALKRI